MLKKSLQKTTATTITTSPWTTILNQQIKIMIKVKGPLIEPTKTIPETATTIKLLVITSTNR